MLMWCTWHQSWFMNLLIPILIDSLSFPWLSLGFNRILAKQASIGSLKTCKNRWNVCSKTSEWVSFRVTSLIFYLFLFLLFLINWKLLMRHLTHFTLPPTNINSPGATNKANCSCDYRSNKSGRGWCRRWSHVSSLSQYHVIILISFPNNKRIFY